MPWAVYLVYLRHVANCGIWMFCTVMFDVDFNVYASTRRGFDVSAGLHSNYSFGAHEVESPMEQNLFLPLSSATPCTTPSKLTVTSVADEENNS